MSLFRTKPIDVNADTGLKRCLGAFDLTMLGIGCIIGTGIFVLTGVVAVEHSGPAIVLSFILSGTACAFAALSYAELAGAIGGAGSAYGYAYSGIGELVAWIIGWDLILEYAIATSTVAIGWSGYFGKILELLGLHLPHSLTNAPLDGGIANVPAMVIVLLLSVLLSIGVRESARFNTVMVFVKLAAVAIFIIVAAPHVNPANWHPFIPPQVTDANGHSHFGYGGVLTGASLIFFAYIGFDAVSTAAEETIKPQRNLPIGIIASLVICTVLYIIVSGILTGVVHYDRIDIKAPIADALKQLGIGWAEALISIGALAGITTVMLVLYFGLTRVVLAMSRDGLLPKPMAKVNPKTQTPVHLILGSGVAIALIADRQGRAAGQSRHSGRLLHGLRQRHRAAQNAAGAQAPIPHAPGTAGAAAGHGLLRLPHGGTAVDNLGGLLHLDRNRIGGFLCLFARPQPTRPSKLIPG